MARIRECAAVVRERQASVAPALDDLKAAVVAAYAAGDSPVDIAPAADHTRPTINAWLEEAGVERRPRAKWGSRRKDERA